MFMVILVKTLVFLLIGRIATLMNLIFMTVPKQMMEMLSRQNQLLMMMLNNMIYPKIFFKAYKMNDETTHVCGETTIIDLGKDLSIQGGVEMNNTTPLEGSSIIL